MSRKLTDDDGIDGPFDRAMNRAMREDRKHAKRQHIPLEVEYTAPEQAPRRPYTPIGARGFVVETKSLSDGRLALRFCCNACSRVGAWLVDRAAVERNGATHVAEGCETREEFAS